MQLKRDETAISVQPSLNSVPIGLCASPRIRAVCEESIIQSGFQFVLTPRWPDHDWLARHVRPSPMLILEVEHSDGDQLREWVRGAACQRLGVRLLLVLPDRPGPLLRRLFALKDDVRYHLVGTYFPYELTYRVVRRLVAMTVPFLPEPDVPGAGAKLPVISRLAATMSSDPRRHRTLSRTLRDSNISRRAFVHFARQEGWVPPLRLFHALRVIVAHDLLRSGANVRRVTAEMGLGSSDTMRRQFVRTVGVTPSAASRLPPAELVKMIRRSA